jgi:hypothetical protein
MSAGQRDDRGQTEMEKLLGRLVPDPAPPGLRERVLGAAVGARRSAALAPWMRMSAAACSVVIVAVLGIDPLVGRRETVRLAAFLGVPGTTEPMARESDSLWAELGVDTGDIDRILLRGIVVSGAKGRESYLKDHLHARDRLKGMIDYENAEDLN